MASFRLTLQETLVRQAGFVQEDLVLVADVERNGLHPAEVHDQKPAPRAHPDFVTRPFYSTGKVDIGLQVKCACDTFSHKKLSTICQMLCKSDCRNFYFFKLSDGQHLETFFIIIISSNSANGFGSYIVENNSIFCEHF